MRERQNCADLHLDSLPLLRDLRLLPSVVSMNTRRVNGATVRVVREALGISHGDLAKRAGISPSFLTRIEQGARQPSPTVAAALSQGLGVALDAITYPVVTTAA